MYPADRRRTTSSRSRDPAWRRSTTTATASPDIYLVNGSTLDRVPADRRRRPQRCSATRGDGTFRDVTADAGVANERWGQGVCAGDYRQRRRRRSLRHELRRQPAVSATGRGRFADVAAQRGRRRRQLVDGLRVRRLRRRRLARSLRRRLRRARCRTTCRPSPAASGAAAATARLRRPRGQRQVGMGAAYSAGAAFCTYRGEQVMCGPRGLRGAPDHLFRNNRDGTFTDVTPAAGVTDTKGLYGFGVAWFDMDDDGRLDLLVANDSGPNYVYRNLGNGTLRGRQLAVRRRARWQRPRSGAHGHRHRRLRQRRPRRPAHHELRRRLQRALPQRRAARASTTSASAPAWRSRRSRFSAGARAFSTTTTTAGSICSSSTATSTRWPTACDWNTSYAQRALLFRNLAGNGRFEDVGAAAGPGLTTAARLARLGGRRSRQRRRRRHRRQQHRLRRRRW